MEIYLIDEANNYTFRYPVGALGEIELKDKKRYTSHEIVDFGTIDLYQPGEEMTDISFKTIFPKYYDSSYCNYSDLQDPQFLKNKFTEFKNSESPLRLIIPILEFNELVNLSEISFTCKAGESDDLYVSNTFRKYREAYINNSNIIKKFSNGETEKEFKTYLSSTRYTKDMIRAGDNVKVNSNSINIHQEPDLNSSTLGSLKQNELVSILRVQGKYGAIAYNGQQGWIKLENISKQEVKLDYDETQQ